MTPTKSSYLAVSSTVKNMKYYVCVNNYKYRIARPLPTSLDYSRSTLAKMCGCFW